MSKEQRKTVYALVALAMTVAFVSHFAPGLLPCCWAAASL